MLKFKILDDSQRDVATYMARPELQAEACRDLALRSITGISAYLLIWLIIYFTSGLTNKTDDILLEFMGFMLAAASVGRLYLALEFDALYAASKQRWRWLFVIGTLITATIWGSVCALAWYNDGFGTTSFMVMLSTAGIAAGGIVSLAPATRLGGFFLMLLLLPSIVFALSTGALPDRGIALLFLTFFVLMSLLWHRLHTEYWRALAGRAELVLAKEAAESANLAKGEFISNVSHELRTPLTAIIGSLGLIKSYLADGIPKQTTNMIDMAFLNSQRLSLLINDILDFEKINAGRMEFQCLPLELSPFLKHAIDLNHPYAEKYGVSFELALPALELVINADEQRLMQVMTNLLSNAVKHSPSGGAVQISTAITGNAVRVAVRDHGEGVPESFRKHIFEKFAQAENASGQKNEGTGLGLAISKAIVERMGGTIGFDSVTGQGATFYFDLPLSSNKHESNGELQRTSTA